MSHPEEIGGVRPRLPGRLRRRARIRVPPTALAAFTVAACLAPALAACRTQPETRWQGRDPMPAAERRYFDAFRPLWREDELAACPELSLAPRYDLRLEVADDLRRVDGTLAVLYTNRLGRPLEELPFFCYPNVAGGALEASAVRVDGAPVQPAWRAGGALLAVPLPSPLPPGGRVSVDMRFTLSVPEGRSGEPGLLALSDGLLSLGHAWPVVPAPAAWSERRPESYGDFVCNEVAFFTARVGLPEGVVLVAPGVEPGGRQHRERGDSGGGIEVTLGPARELYLAAGRDLVLLEERRGDLTVRSVAARGQELEAQAMLEAAHAALQIFGRRFGPYPFTTFSVLAVPLRALGMEFPGIVVLASRLYGPPRDPRRRFELEGTLAHEAAHQWFYALVGSDQLREPWIDESLAQYAFWLYYLDRYGDATAAWRELEDTWGRADRAEIPIGLPVDAYSRDEYGAIIYGRAPLFLAALAELMGQERFDRFLRDLVRRHRWGMIDGEGFRALAAEAATGAGAAEAPEAGTGAGGPAGADAGALDRLWAQWVLPRPPANPHADEGAR